MTLLTRIHLHTHRPDLPRFSNIEHLTDDLELVRHPILCGVKTVAQIDAIEEKLRKIPELLAGAEIYDDGLPVLPDQAVLLDVIMAEAGQNLTEDRSLFWTRYLGVPPIPKGAPVAYCIQARWMVQELQDVVASSDVPGPIMKAAMAEEVMIV